MNRRIVAIIQTLSVLVLMSFGAILTKIVLASIPINIRKEKQENEL